MSSFTQTIVHSCATLTSGHQCKRKGFQSLCLSVGVVIIICTIYLFKAKDTTVTSSQFEDVGRVPHDASVTEILRMPSVQEQKTTVKPPAVPSVSSATPHCEPHKSVVMIKTHKSGSSTLQNILLRKAESEDLKVALPRDGPYLKDNLGFHRDVIYLDDGERKYNILASHMHLSTQEFPAIATVMEGDTKWLSVLRNPVKQFESLYTYYGWQQFFNVDLRTFLEHPQDHFQRFVGDRVSSRNPMCYDNGLDARFLDSRETAVVDNFISLLDRQFDLVLLADYFDESLILLKDLFCWSLKDIVYLNGNSRSKDSIQALGKKQEESIKEWNWADVLLYQHFNETLHRKIDNFGRSRMSKELEQFRQLKEELALDCVKEQLSGGDTRVWYPWGIKVNSFVANPDGKDPTLCEQLCTPELLYLHKMRTKMLEENTIKTKDVPQKEKKETETSSKQGFLRKYVATVDNTEKDRRKNTPHLNGSASNQASAQVVLDGNNIPSEKNTSKIASKPPKEGGRPESLKKCSPLERVVMIKTHKCSSSTLQNILLRRAEDRNVSIALPQEGVYFSQAYPFNRQFIFQDDRKRKYDIMASHMKFSLGRFQDIKNVMNTGTKYITILRDPAEQYESMYTYYGFRGRFGADLHTFLRHPQLYFESKENRHSIHVGRNPMCHDNGLDARFLEPGDPNVEKFVSVLDKWQDLVLIAEYFDESLILLKDLMCWELEDIIYLKQNARSKDSVVGMSEEEKDSMRKWNWADTMLYSHFNRTLWKKVAEYGQERMRRDVAELRAKNEELANDCVSRTMDRNDPRMWYPQGIRVNSFQVRRESKHPHLCSQLTRPELKFLQKLREKVSAGR